MLVTVGNLHDVIVDPGISRCKDHLKILYGTVPHLDIVSYRIFEHRYILIDYGNRTCYYFTRIAHPRFPVEKDLSAPWLIKT